MENIINLLKTIWEFIYRLFKENPAGWIMAILLFLTLMFELKIQRKKVKIIPRRVARNGKETYGLVVANTGSKAIYIESFGYKKWNGEIIELEYPRGSIYQRFEPEHPREDLKFYNWEIGEPIPINENEIYYVYIKTSGDKIFKKYSSFFLISWLTYLYNKFFKR